MTDQPENFDLSNFLPYLLNQAAEAASRSFQEVYRAEFGLTRTGWRILANLGKFGAMTAVEICRVSHMEKTKVSRAVAALQQDGLLQRETAQSDRRAEYLSLTPKGRDLFWQLGSRANDYDRALRNALGEDAATALVTTLRRLMQPEMTGLAQ